MRLRIALLILAALALVGIWCAVVFLPHPPSYTPKFLAGAQDAPNQSERLQNAPFVKKLGPNSSQNLGTAGVTFHDYLTTASFDATYKKAQDEFKGQGWESFFSFSVIAAPGKFMPASKADALFTRGDDAVTIYRALVDGKTRVRVWHRGPSLFGL